MKVTLSLQKIIGIPAELNEKIDTTLMPVWYIKLYPRGT